MMFDEKFVGHVFAPIPGADVCAACGEIETHRKHTTESVSDRQLQVLTKNGDGDTTFARMAKELLARRNDPLHEINEAQKHLLGKLEKTNNDLVKQVERLKIEREQALERATRLDTDVRYRDFIPAITREDSERLLQKDREYGASWKRRGGVGAYFTMIRKVDRLNAQVPGNVGYDIFQHLGDAQYDNNGESLLDTIRDLRGYLILIEAEHRVRMKEEVPKEYSPEQDAEPESIQDPTTNHRADARLPSCNGLHDDGTGDDHLTRCSVKSGCGLVGCPYRERPLSDLTTPKYPETARCSTCKCYGVTVDPRTGEFDSHTGPDDLTECAGSTQRYDHSDDIAF